MIADYKQIFRSKNFGPFQRRSQDIILPTSVATWLLFPNVTRRGMYVICWGNGQYSTARKHNYSKKPFQFIQFRKLWLFALLTINIKKILLASTSNQAWLTSSPTITIFSYVSSKYVLNIYEFEYHLIFFYRKSLLTETTLEISLSLCLAMVRAALLSLIYG